MQEANNVKWEQKECYGGDWGEGKDHDECMKEGIHSFPTIRFYSLLLALGCARFYVCGCFLCVCVCVNIQLSFPSIFVLTCTKHSDNA